MTSYHVYNAAHAAADRLGSYLKAIRQAEIDVRPFVGNSGMALDSAEAIYRHALVEGCGLPEQDVRHLNVNSLRVLLKHQPTPSSQAWRSRPAMAFDSSSGVGDPTLSAILDGIPRPRDYTTKADLRR
jgi:hypothetical protein